MKYFKNTELARLYNVSEKSVRNWVQATNDGKMELQLYLVNDKPYVADTSKNISLIEQLVQKGKKYKNTRAIKHVQPKQQFYKVASSNQILDLISNIDINREIPHLYSYLDGGADYWDQYVDKLLHEKSPNSLTNTIELLEFNKQYIDKLISQHSGVNVIDIGIGNCVPVRQLLMQLLEQNTLRRYIGIDTSSDMLKLADNNIQKWFNGRITLEPNIKDISYDRFKDLIISDSFSGKDESVLNLVLFLGGTISNLRDPSQTLRIISNSMSKNDILVITRKLDTPVSRRFFDFTVETADHELSLQERNMLNLMGIEDQYYSVEQLFDEQEMARKIQIRALVDLSIAFNVEDKERTVFINKGESILLWRSDHQTMQDTIAQVNNNGFDVLQATKSMDEQYLIVLAKIKQAGH